MPTNCSARQWTACCNSSTPRATCSRRITTITGSIRRLVFTAPRAGRHIVRVFAFPAVATGSIGFAGSDKFVYRLTLTTAGFLDYAFPLALAAGASGEVELFGWNIAAAARGSKTWKSLAAGESAHGFRSASGRHGRGCRRTVRGDYRSRTQRRVNLKRWKCRSPSAGVSTSPATSMHLHSPAKKASGCLSSPCHVAWDSQSPRSGAENLFDERGKQLAQADDVSGGRDAELAFAVPVDGRYRVSVADFAGQGGPRYAYRLDITAAEPEFELKLPADTLAITPSKPAELTVEIDRRNGFAEEISFEGLALPRGISVEPAKSAAKGDSAKTVRLKFTAAADAASGPVRVVGKSTGGKTQTASAGVGELATRQSEVWLATVGDGVVEN